MKKTKKNKTKWGKYLKKTGTQDGTDINRLLYPHIPLYLYKKASEEVERD